MPLIAADTNFPRWLLCRVGSRLCALPVENIVETMRPLPIEPLAQSPPFVLGLCLLRGSPVPVVDARLLFGEHGDPPERLVAIRVGSRLIALAVDSVIGLRSIEADTSVGLPLLLQDAGDVVAAVGTLDAELLLVLNTARIVPQAVLDSVDAEGTSL